MAVPPKTKAQPMYPRGGKHGQDGRSLENQSKTLKSTVIGFHLAYRSWGDHG